MLRKAVEVAPCFRDVMYGELHGALTGTAERGNVKHEAEDVEW